MSDDDQKSEYEKQRIEDVKNYESDFLLTDEDNSPFRDPHSYANFYFILFYFTLFYFILFYIFYILCFIFYFIFYSLFFI